MPLGQCGRVGVETGGHCVEEFAGARPAECVGDRICVGEVVQVAYAVGFAEEKVASCMVLETGGYALAPLVDVEVGHVIAVDADLARARDVEASSPPSARAAPATGFGQCRLSGTVVAHDCHSGNRRQVQVHVVQGVGGAEGVAVRDSVETDAVDETRRGDVGSDRSIFPGHDAAWVTCRSPGTEARDGAT